MTSDPIHDALPWFVNETLEPEEAAVFERHLMTCADCKKELEFIEDLKRQIERDGDDFLAGHPSPEALLSLILPAAADEQLSDDEASRIRRHLALCVTCAEEAGWMRGEASVGPAVAAPPSRERVWRWAAVAAMLLLATTATLWVREGSKSAAPGLIDFVIIDETARTGAGRVEVAVPPGSTDVYLVFPLDLDASVFPVTFEIVGSSGESLYRREVARAELSGGYYLGIRVPSRDLPAGDYLARVSATRGDVPTTEYSFRVSRSSP